jgi:pyruvate formate lyase activating enzyme
MINLSRQTDDNKAECLLCPHNCRLSNGKYGICRVRKNNGGTIESDAYGIISSLALDPVEKKPLYHFFPGHNILSAGSYGCNMRCDFCQNFTISQNSCENINRRDLATPEFIVERAKNSADNIGIAYTYNEPVIWYEFIIDTAGLARKMGLYNVLVSNGFINPEPLAELLKHTDAFNIDLKAFREEFYRKYTGASLEPVKNSLKAIVAAGRHLEITTLVIPGLNDSEKEMSEEAEWIAGELGKDVPLHLSRYFPMYRRDNPVTPEQTLQKLYEIAAEKLDYVYIGNTRTGTGQDTKCPDCGTIVTKRSGYSVQKLNLDGKGACLKCGRVIYRNFSASSSFPEQRSH